MPSITIPNHMQTSATPLPLCSTSLPRPYNHHNPTKDSPTSSPNISQTNTLQTPLKPQHQSLQLVKSRNQKKKRNHRQNSSRHVSPPAATTSRSNTKTQALDIKTINIETINNNNNTKSSPPSPLPRNTPLLQQTQSSR
jgi:hypothetical protein